MNTPLKNSQDKRPITTPKASFISGQSTVFSYTVKKGLSTVVLSQQETGFSLSMKMEQLEGTLRVTKFTLARNAQLKYLSQNLNNAALLEIVVQALVILFACAEQCYACEILFMLSQADATHLTDFESFFDATASLDTREGSKSSFTVYNTPETREFLEEKVETIKTRLKQELWQAQREDRYIKDFLQNHPRGMLLPCVTLKTEDVNPSMGNVIPFPQSRRK
ncbi:hypothetical protein [Candidatus Paracaedibacter symbiosus]|uniref:hypothetical protein n=1 Tax=Candidatus Paracaedibacter symbiosus TaxID=244582 RepID=UPI000509C057|nr:hypothetical protein [Candidatus Paracaedibacter symbiosus]